MAVGEYDSLVGTGAINGAWGGTLSNAEYVVYDEELVEVAEIHIYKQVSSPNKYWWWDQPKVLKGPIKYHPCQKDCVICKNAYGSSGCIAHKKKAGGTKKEFQYCREYEPNE